MKLSQAMFLTKIETPTGIS